MRFFLISDNNDTLMGMRLAGIEGVVVHERQEVREAIEAAMRQSDIGVLLLSEKLSALCPDLVYQLKMRTSGPLLVEIPDRHGTGRAPDSITRYVREAIGVKV